MAEEPRARPSREKLRDAWRRLRGGELTPARAAFSVAIGVAIGCTPLFGVHWLLVLLVCVPLRLDAPVALLASNVSIPPVAPLIMFAEVQTGHMVIGGMPMAIDLETFERMGPDGFMLDLIVGVAIFAPLAGVVFGATTGAVVWTIRRARARA